MQFLQRDRKPLTMTLSTSQLQTDTWVKATWDEFAAIMDDPLYESGRGYFDNGTMRIEMASLGRGHARQNAVVTDVISLYAALAYMLHCVIFAPSS